MANKTIRIQGRSLSSHVDQLYIDKGNNQYVQAVAIDSMPTSVSLTDAQLRASPIETLYKSTTVSVEFTRDNNATPYGIGDVISGSAGIPLVYELVNLMRSNGGSGQVLSVRVTFNVKSVSPLLRLNFFNSSNPTISGDNLPHKELYSDYPKRLGYVDLPVMATAADVTNSDMSRTMSLIMPYLPVQSVVNSRSIWVSLQTLSAVTLTALSKVLIIVSVLND